MRKLVLNEEESKELKERGVVEIERAGFSMLIEKNNDEELYPECKDDELWQHFGYTITIIDDFDKIIIK